MQACTRSIASRFATPGCAAPWPRCCARATARCARWTTSASCGSAAWAAWQLETPPSAGHVVAFLIAFAAAGAVIYSLWIALMCTTFWSVGAGNIGVLFDAVWEAARYPVSAYPGALRFLFVYLLPIAWTTTVPASALTGRLGWSAAAASVVVAGTALALSRLLWTMALRRYTSAGG